MPLRNKNISHWFYYENFSFLPQWKLDWEESSRQERQKSQGKYVQRSWLYSLKFSGLVRYNQFYVEAFPSSRRFIHRDPRVSKFSFRWGFRLTMATVALETRRNPFPEVPLDCSSATCIAGLAKWEFKIGAWNRSDESESNGQWTIIQTHPQKMKC